MVNAIRWVVVAASLGVATACNVSATQAGSGGVGAGDGGGACDRGTVALLTDYMSTEIALGADDGTTLSPSFLSTASTKASGDAFPLSGDVLLPRNRPASGRVVLIDSYGTDVITWADPATAKVLGQLPVGTGFESDAWDYLEVDATRAYVTRYGVNESPGTQRFDGGSDVLVVDTQSFAITGTIPMPVEQGFPPRPSSMLPLGDTVLVVLQRTSLDFTSVGESALVGLKNDAIAWELHVTGMQSCDRPTLSPSGRTMAIACAGQLAMDGTVADPSQTGIQLFDVTTSPPRPTQRFAVIDQLGSSVQNGVTWVSETMLLGKTQTPAGGSANNQAFTLDLGTGKAAVLLSASPDAMGKGKGLVYGDVLCRPGCGDVCLLADGDTGKLRRWKIAGAQLEPMADVTVDPVTGLPPSLLGGY